MTTLTIHSGEKIQKRYLDSFLRTNILSLDPKISKKSFIYASYVESLLSYQVIIFDIPIPNIFLLESSSKNGYELFILEYSFVLYKDQMLYYYQELQEGFNIEDVEEFVRNSLKIDQFNITKENIVKYKKSNNHKFIRVNKSNLFKYFITYILALVFALNFYDYILQDDTNSYQKIEPSVINNYENIEYDYASKKILEIYIKAQENSIDLNQIVIKNSNISITFQTNKKDDIYTFINNFEKSQVNLIAYDKKIKRFKVDASFKLSRKNI